MKLGVIPENVLERVALAAGVVPRPILDTLVAMMLARTIMAATKLGIFEALASGPLPAHQVAAHCGTDPRATEKLLTALAGCGYVRAAHGQYVLAPVARKWLLEDGPVQRMGVDRGLRGVRRQWDPPRYPREDVGGGVGALSTVDARACQQLGL